MRVERLEVESYRVLRSVEFRDVAPLTVLCGPNGSGKSTVFDLFAFLHQASTQGLRAAWDARNRIQAIGSRGAQGPVTFEIAYRTPNESGANGLQRAKYHTGGLPKVSLAREVSVHLDPDRNRSASFRYFRDTIRLLTEEAA